jgi:carboxymethylenebutenolidase
MSKVASEYVEIKVDDGTGMPAWFAKPTHQPARRGLLVFQEAFGVNAHIRDVTDRFAALGYAAISPELFHRTTPPKWEGDYDNIDRKHLQALTETGMENDIRATYDWLKSRVEAADAIACVGYCMGGRASFVANSTVPLKAAVSYYGGGIQTLLARTGRISAPMLFIWGEMDHHITAEHRSQIAASMREAGKEYVDTVFSYADHGFFCDARKSYHPKAARIAWEATQSFLNAHF